VHVYEPERDGSHVCRLITDSHPSANASTHIAQPSKGPMSVNPNGMLVGCGGCGVGVGAGEGRRARDAQKKKEEEQKKKEEEQKKKEEEKKKEKKKG
jgi:hypothetical protein